MVELLKDLALPRTDAAVAVQAGVVFPLLLAALVAFRRDREVRLLVTGLLVMSVSLFGLRAVH